MLQYTNDYKIGISEIDQEHEQLFKIINDTGCLLKEGNTPLEVLAKSLKKQLSDYASTHFQHEEAYMEKIHDPELNKQKKEHRQFIHKVSSLFASSAPSQKELEDTMEFLMQWLFHHILSSDMLIGHFDSSSSPDDTDPFAFTAKYETGIDQIDTEHKQLFAIIKDANDLIRNTTLHDKYDQIITLLEQLKEYTQEHFSHEEEYMEKLGYPNLSQQNKAHEAFIEKLVRMDINQLEELDDNQQQYLIDLIDYLLNWLTNHILLSDKQIGEYAKNH